MYQALYRQYRPRTFDELLGQKHITTILQNQIIKGNIGHAYLFSGTRGTGKTSAAKVFSRAVNCLNPKDGNPCNECAVCRGILDESLMDVIEMDAASNRKIEDIRELKEKVIYPPSKARYKVYIIDEVHMLTNEAFNALLKTLEEPPKHLIFLLATTEPERLPHTILSRCQRFDFKRLTVTDMVQSMRKISATIGVQVEDRVLELIAKNSDGAMRDALSLLDQCISFSEDRVTYEDAINILGFANGDLLFEMIDDIKTLQVDKTLEMVNHIIQEGKDISQFLKDMIHHYRNLLIVKTSKSPQELVDWGDVMEYKKQVEELSLHYLMRSLEILTFAENSMKWSTQPRIILEMAVIKLLNLNEELSLEERVRLLEEGRVLGIKEKPIEKPKPAAPEVQRKEQTQQPKDEITPVKPKESIKVDLSLDSVKKSWPKVMQAIKAKKINIYALVMEGEVAEIKGNRITLAYKNGFEFHKDAVNAPVNKSFLEILLTEFFGQTMELLVIMKECIPKDGEEIPTDPKKSDEEAINDVIDFFGKDIVEIK